MSYLKRGSNKHMAVLTITHDRYFLDALCSDIYELDRGNLFKYVVWRIPRTLYPSSIDTHPMIVVARRFSDCNYSRYVEQREKRLAAEEAKLENAKVGRLLHDMSNTVAFVTADLRSNVSGGACERERLCEPPTERPTSQEPRACGQGQFRTPVVLVCLTF